MIIKQEQFMPKDTVETTTDLLIRSLTMIKDNIGEFLLDFDDLEVDDKSWAVWGWPQGVGLYGIYKDYRGTKSEKALQVVDDWLEGWVQEGVPPKNMSTMAPLLTMAYLYENTKDSKYIPYLEQQAEWVMEEMPRTDKGNLQRAVCGPESRNQLWDNALMVTILPLAKIGKLLNRLDYLEEAKHQFLIHIKYLQDRKSGLWYHGWAFEGDHNCTKALWAKGNCWITITIPKIIEILELSKGDSLRELLLSTFNAQVAALTEYQNESGLWHTSINDSNSYLKSFATAGFAYGILKAVRKKYISSEYEEMASKATTGSLDGTDETEEV